MAEEFVMACAVFMRDGTARVEVLHRGPKEDCERMQDLIPAVVADADAQDAQTFVWPATKFDEFSHRLSGKGD